MFMANVMTFVATIFAVYGRDNLGYSSKPAFVGLGLIGAIAVRMDYSRKPLNSGYFLRLEGA